MISALKRMSLKIQITFMTIFFCLVCILSVASSSIYQTKKALLDLSVEQLSSMSKVISTKTSDYFNEITIYTDILSKDRLIEGLFIAFEGSFYGGAFSSDKDQQIMTANYQANYKTYGERVKSMVHNYKLNSIFLISINGQILMNSNVDNGYHFLGRNLLKGELKDSALAKCYTDAMASKNGEKFFADFAFYKTSDDIHSFLCQKSFAEFNHADEGINKGDTLGVIVTEIDQALISGFLSLREGMGETGQMFLVGNDQKLRSNKFLNSEKFNVKNSITNNISIDSKTVIAALEGKNGFDTILNMQGKEVLSVYSPLSVFGQKWAFIAEKSVPEILKPVNETIKVIVYISLGLFVLVLCIVWYSTIIISRPITKSNLVLENVSNNVAHKASDVKNYSINLGNSAGGLASSIQETVSTMEEITQMVNKNLEHVELSTKMSESSQGAANEGLNIVNQLQGAMSDINGTNEKISEEMQELGTQMEEIIKVIEEIGTKTSVINDIVFQTKLLSFNASVEAARAGEHGKGFAVVAEEVGNLASASGKAANEISNMLHESVVKVQDIVTSSKNRIGNVTQEGKSKIQFGLSVATKCDEQLRMILENVSRVHNTITEVKHASNEQATGIREVSLAMQQLDQISNDTQQISTDVLKIANDLNLSSSELGHVVVTFKGIVEGYKHPSSVDTNIEDNSAEASELSQAS